MATKAQINANRSNSKKSTGPQSDEGKAAVSQNAFKHGLFVNKAVVRDESQDEYDLHREALLAEMGPVGEMESILADRVVNLSWRLKRAERMQNQSIDYLGLDEVDGIRARDFKRLYRDANGIPYGGELEVPADHLLLGRLATRDFTNYRVLDRMMLYERRIENSLHKTRAEFAKLKAARKAEEQSSAESAPVDNEAHLKKQSQSAPARMGATLSVRKAYANKPPGGVRENKPNQSQFQTAAPPKKAGKRQGSFEALAR
ncbi:MAG: hypothetical protein U9Q07_05245 [Planctomycetota bacterium]|nr:hypothetical protein [Planctomycetota bacterium]